MSIILAMTIDFRDEESPWIYRNSVELKQAPYAGTLAMYKGGGYTFTFKRTREDTERLLKVAISALGLKNGSITKSLLFQFHYYQ